VIAPTWTGQGVSSRQTDRTDTCPAWTPSVLSGPRSTHS